MAIFKSYYSLTLAMFLFVPYLYLGSLIPAVAATQLRPSNTSTLHPFRTNTSDSARPNFVFILMDDWGVGDVGAYHTLTNHGIDKVIYSFPAFFGIIKRLN